MKTGLMSLLLLAVSLSAHAQSPTSGSDEIPLLPLELAIQVGLKQNYALRVARYNYDEIRNNRQIGNAGMLPSLDVQAARNVIISDINLEILGPNGVPFSIDRDGARTDLTNIGMALSWTVFDGTKMFIEYDRLKELEKVGEVQFRRNVQATIQEIINAYYVIVRETFLFEVLEQNIEISQQRLKLATDQFEFGQGSRLQKLQAEVDLNTDRSAYLRQKVIIQNAKTELSRIIAYDFQTDYMVEKEIPIQEQIQFASLRDAAMVQNPDMQTARFSKSIADFERRSLNANWWPEVQVGLAYNYNLREAEVGNLLLNREFAWNYGVTARLNLFEGFNLQRQIQNSKMRIKSAELDVLQVQDRITAELLANWRLYQNSLELIQLEKKNQDVAQENLEISLERFQLGTITPIELREAQRNVLDVGARLVRAQFEAKEAETRLKFISGMLIE